LQRVDADGAAHLVELGTERGIVGDLLFVLGGELLQVDLEVLHVLRHLHAGGWLGRGGVAVG